MFRYIILSIIFSLSFNFIFGQTSLTVAENFSVKTPDGVTIDLYDILDNGQYALIDFFNITCGPCQIFAPDVQLSCDHFGNNGEDVFFMGLSYSGGNAQIIEWDSIYGITYPTVSGFEGGATNVHLDYGVLSVPTLVLVAPDKNIAGQLYLPDYIPETSVIDSMLIANGLVPVFTGNTASRQSIKSTFNIYPNPAKDYINISYNFRKNISYRFELFNILGNKVNSFEYQGSFDKSISIPIGNLSDGFYLIRLFSGDKLLGKQKIYVVD